MPALRLRVEFHLFLTALSVRPGSSFAMADHLLPLVSWALMMTASSHSENAPFFTAGLR